MDEVSELEGLLPNTHRILTIPTPKWSWFKKIKAVDKKNVQQIHKTLISVVVMLMEINQPLSNRHSFKKHNRPSSNSKFSHKSLGGSILSLLYSAARPGSGSTHWWTLPTFTASFNSGDKSVQSRRSDAQAVSRWPGEPGDPQSLDWHEPGAAQVPGHLRQGHAGRRDVQRGGRRWGYCRVNYSDWLLHWLIYLTVSYLSFLHFSI